ncbi:hypothetical protein MTO96_000372 [Rhipicephalus appendiculatus]
MLTFQQDLKDTAVQLVKSLECPICLEILRDPLSTSCHHRFCRLCLEKALQDNYKIPCPLCKAVVTKRSLTQSDLIVKLVDKVKQLVQAVKIDTGVEVTPPRSQLEPANGSLERRSVHSSAQKAATSSKSSLNFGSRTTNKRAFVVHTDADIGAASKRPRSTSTAVHDKPAPSKDRLERSEAQESCSGPAEKQLGSNRFFTSANQASIVSGKRNSVLDVSDTDPYKFIPSQKSLQAAQRGKRRRLRGNGRAAGLGAKRLSRRKSDQQKSVCEFENLRDLCAEEKAQEEDDARELEIELFVTPGVRPCVEKKGHQSEKVPHYSKKAITEN